MKRIFIAETIQRADETVHVAGWVHTRRDHGKLIFIDLRDRSGLLQVVFRPTDTSADMYERAKTLRAEWVVAVEGKIAKRPEAMQNPNLATGTLELIAETLAVASEAEPPPFEISDEQIMKTVDEELRLRYRYLDLRRPALYERIATRHRVTHFIRTFLSERGFVEVETPILTKSTPEGARDYLVPSRLHQGKFYALPQSPQQYKQLLMVAGLERYFQIARCFRDEDMRSDRQAEFTQLDIEMSFVTREEVMELNEELLIELVKRNFPEKKIAQIPFPRLSYKDAIERYGTDRPDLRADKNNPDIFAFCWVVDFPFFERAEGGGWTFTHNPFSAPKTEYMADLLAGRNIERILTTQYDIVLNGSEIGGGSIRNHTPRALEAVFIIMGFDVERVRAQFGHMLEAFASGAPPHGGIAWGFDRLLAIILNQPNIREVIAFPKTGDGRDPMMGSPSEVDAEQLKELGLQLRKK